MVVDKTAEWLQTALERYRSKLTASLNSALEFKSIERNLVDAVKHLPQAGGKRLRPILVLVTADAIGNDDASITAIPFAVAIELIHNFTLVHDDIMDQDELRRGVKTVHTIYGIPTAINAGDVLFALAFETVTALEMDSVLVRKLVYELASMVRIIGIGQQSDLNFEHRKNINVEDYMIMIENKTAKMFEVATKGGAMIAGGTDQQIDAMATYGKMLGIGFQIRDDILGLVGDVETFGKPIGADLRRGKKTLPIIYGLNHAEGDELQLLLDVLGNTRAQQDDVEQAIQILHKVGAIKYATGLATSYADKARTSLKRIETTCKDMQAYQILDAFINYIVKREV